MSGEVSGAKKRVEDSSEERVEIEAVGVPQHVQSPNPPPPPASSSLDFAQNGVNSVRSGGTTNGKSDSEAETVVLRGKDDAEVRNKAIKQETEGDSKPHKDPKLDRHGGSDWKVKQEEDNKSSRASLKRKRGRETSEASVIPADWNALSSPPSSPAFETHSPRSSDSNSDQSRSSPPSEEAKPKKGSRRCKPRQEHEADDQARQKRGNSDPSSEQVTAKERRGTRSATHHELPIRRSESPPIRVHERARSIQSNLSESHRSKRRKAPQPLLIDQAHGDSDDSNSVYSRPSLQKLASIDNNSMSKVSKKNRDKNGRTLLARACALDELEAEARLNERPEDLDIPDNAGNTPLQIASLEGKARIVHLLLEAGCDINCKNTDMETPLIDAVENGHIDVVRMLLKAGLDPRQSNAKGEEPLDLVNPENDHYDAIRAALITAKEKANPRRFSEEHNLQNQRDQRYSVGSRASPTESLTLHTSLHTSSYPATSPLHNSHSAKSPPPGVRRRTARSQPTRDGLLWVTPTEENLRDAAGKGDVTIVDHILKMRPEAGSESVLAAARGGHRVVIELLIAIGKPDPDPDPIRSSEYKPAYSTPMLAAIGRGNIDVLKLLLNQPGFDPTRRPYRNIAYYDLAVERKSPVWQEEYRVLKEAYDNHTRQRSKKVNHGSPHKKRANKSSELPSHKSNSSSPLSGRSRNSHSAAWEPKEDNKRDSKQLHSASTWEPKEEHRRDSKYSQSTAWEPKEKEDNKHDSKIHQSAAWEPKEDNRRDSTQFPPKSLRPEQENRDRTFEVQNSKPLPRGNRSASDAGQAGHHKRRKLLSRNALKDTTRETIKDPPNDTTKRRASLTESETHKKRRLDTNSLTLDPPRQFQQRPAKVANMISPDSAASPTVAPAAPVAFMGTSGSSPVLQSPIRKSPALKSPVLKSPVLKPSLDKKEEKTTTRGEERELPPKEPRKRDQSPKETRKGDMSPNNPRKRDQSPKDSRKRQRVEVEVEEKRRMAREEESRLNSRRQSQEAEKKKRDEEISKKRAEQERLRKEEQERLRKEDHEEKERVRKEDEQRLCREEEERRREEGERRLKEEEESRLKEAEERRLKEAEERRLKEDEERRLKEEEEKARREEEERIHIEEQKRLRKEEERFRREEEEERLRKEEEDRRRKEEDERRLREEREERERFRVLEEQERQRREALPISLRRAAELSSNQARQESEITRWLPLFTFTTRDLDPDCEDQIAKERWIANVQAAPILAITDLNLSQCENRSIFFVSLALLPLLLGSLAPTPSNPLSLSLNNLTRSLLAPPAHYQRRARHPLEKYWHANVATQTHPPPQVHAGRSPAPRS